MWRGVAQLSLLLTLAVWARPYALPWREKNVFKVATSLPARLIDSIMAQGNWNILFQEGPFNEFQRQIAIANHFALRGDARQANSYFQKASNALDIAYASFRGRFGWPRDASVLRADALPSGENRETFEDFILCRLQLQIESLLAEHESGVLKSGNILAAAAETEKQLSISIRQKDADLEQMIGILRDAIAIRSQKENHPAVQAEKFAALSDKITPSTRNYWNRRINIFKIFENIHHGNTGRAFFLTRYQEEKLKDQTDAMSLARIYIQLGAFDVSLRLITAALNTPENNAAENYSEHVAYSTLAQNLHIWQARYADAARLSLTTSAFLGQLVKSESVPRDELVDLKKSFTNELLRNKIYAFILSGKCPEAASFTGETDMEKEWLIRERFFYEACNRPRDLKYWSALVKSADTTPETKALVTFHLADDKVKIPAGKKPSALSAYLSAHRALQTALSKNNKQRLAELTVTYLKARNTITPQFILFDWGIPVSEDLTPRALDGLPQTMSDKTAGELFFELHRRFAWNSIQGGGFKFFPPADAAPISRKIAAAILDFPTSVPPELPTATPEGKRLVYADAYLKATYDPRAKKQKFKIIKKEVSKETTSEENYSGGTLLFGSAIADPGTGASAIAPFRVFCPQCSKNAEKAPERLVLLAAANSPHRSFTNDLADNFSVVSEAAGRICPGGATRYEDSVILSADVPPDFQAPCNLSAEKIIVEYDDKSLSAAGIQAALALGWRPGLALILMPRALPDQIKTSFLFDFFQRTNRRQVKTAEAFREAKLRAEKSFPAEAALQSLLLYESLP